MLAASVPVLLLLSIQCATADSAGSTASGGGIRSRAVREEPVLQVYGPAEEHRTSVDGPSRARGASKGKPLRVAIILFRELYPWI